MKSLVFLFLCFLVFKVNAQCDCSAPIIPPQTINGVNITTNFTGSVGNYTTAFTSCGTFTTPANSIWLGQSGSFSYTLNFSLPVDSVCIIITATGQGSNENFVITTNSGIPTIIDQQSCFSTITGNEIISGAGAGSGGGAGIFQIVGSTGFTSVTVTGNGGANGSLFAFCANSIVPDTATSNDSVLLANFDDICIDEDPLILTQGSPAGGTYFGTGVSNGIFDPNIAGIGTHTIYYTYTDTSNSTDTAINTIEVRPLPVISLDTIINVSCFNLQDAEIHISASNGNSPYDFEWSNGDQTQNLMNVGAGNYYVILSDLYGCEDSASYEITEPNSLIGTVTVFEYPGGNNVSCFNSTDGRVDVTTAGGIGPYSYLWSNGDTTIPLTGVGAGTYTLSVTDQNNCLEILQVNLTEPDSLISNLTALQYIGGSNVSCYDAEDGVITSSIVGGIYPYFYNWSNGDSDSIINYLAADTYFLTVTDTNGCETQNTIVLTQPDSISIDTNISIVNCLGSIELLPAGGISPYTFNWANGESTQSIDSVISGSYSATVTDANNCEQYINVTIQSGDQLETNASSVNVSCHNIADGSAEVSPLNGQAPFSYLWSNAAQTPDISNLDTGTYTVLVTDANNCEAYDTISITQPDSLLSSISGINVSCYTGSDGQAFVTANGGTEPYSFEWNISGDASEISGLSNGLYTVTITDSNGCISYEEILIFQPLPMWVRTDTPVYEISLGDEVEVLTDYFANGRSVENYQWEPSEGLDCDNCESTLASPIEETLYTIEITDEMGCKADTTFLVKIKPDKIFYIPTAFSPNGDGLNDEFRVYAQGVENFHLQIFDRWGTLIFETRDIEKTWDGYYHGKALEPEVYVYHVYADFLDNAFLKKKGSITLLR